MQQNRLVVTTLSVLLSAGVLSACSEGNNDVPKLGEANPGSQSAAEVTDEVSGNALVPDAIAYVVDNNSNADSPSPGNETSDSVAGGNNPSPVDNPSTGDATDSAANNTQDSTDTDNDTVNTPPVVEDGVFESSSTSGFTANVSGNNVELRWANDDGARGYNVYRGGEYITTVMEEHFTDNNLPDGAYYYEIISFDNNDHFEVVADALTAYVGVPVLGAANGETPLPDHVSSDYQLVFSEEFDGNTLDTTKWNTEYLWGDELFINSEEQYYVDVKNDPNFGFDPFSVSNGMLTIEAIRTPDNLKDKAFGQPYLSGVITSYDSFQFTYGYVEARARAPYGQGLWSAFWLLNAYYVERKPEIDIMEHIGDNRDVVYHTYHYYDPNGELRSTDSLETTGIDFTSEFHTYGVEWLPGKIIFYIDGIERHRITDPNVSAQSMYIIANTALGGWWPGSPDETTPFPTKYEIDYIRAYQKPGVQLDASILNDDGLQTIPLADGNPTSPPNRIPTPEQWPQAYPELQ